MSPIDIRVSNFCIRAFLIAESYTKTVMCDDVRLPFDVK